MAASLVRVHPAGTGMGTGSTASTAISVSAVPIGDVLIALTASRSRAAVELSRPAAETATWELLADSNDTSITVQIWAIKTTVSWPIDEPVVATFTRASSVSGPEYGYFRTIQLAQFTGVDVVTRGDATVVGFSSTPLSLTVPSALPGDLVLAVAGARNYNPHDSTDPGCYFVADTDTVRGTWQNDGTTKISGQGWNTSVAYHDGLLTLLQHKLPTSAGSQTFDVEVLPGSDSASAAVVVLRSAADPPNAPALTTMASGGVVDRAVANRAAWEFSDNNYGDTQSAFDLRYRTVGAATWTTVAKTTNNQFYDFAAASLAAGDYEWQVRTYDSIGLVGPYSPSGFFTAADKPTGVTITDPINGQTIALSSHTVTWSAPNHTSYQLRKVADSAGSPDTATVYYDSGEVASTSARSLAVDFPVNDRTEHVQVRIKYDGLWSEWATVMVLVSYTPPSTPTATLSFDAATGSLLIAITNPAPAEGAPATSYNDIYVNDGDGEERKATSVTPNSEWRYWTPVSSRDYSTAVRVVAVGTNGTTAST